METLRGTRSDGPLGSLRLLCVVRAVQVPDGLTEEQFKRLLQMRTDGTKEEEIQAEMMRMRREDQEETKKYMLRSEVRRARERASIEPCGLPRRL